MAKGEGERARDGAVIDWASAAPPALAAFMASLVEFVEALTIVLAVGVVRGWRSALLGTAAALAVLVVMVAALGPALTRIPLPIVQLVVGTLLLLFGLRWLRKAILRAALVLPRHDEAQAFASETAALQQHGAASRHGFDALAFTTSFKIVMLEGIEVVFIVIAIGSSGRLLLPAAAGALFALIVVAALGLWLHRPLARVPENALKFGVGVMLVGFGTFWVGEGIGLEWPGHDWALFALLAAYLAVALALVPACKRAQAGRRAVVAPATQVPDTTEPGVLATIARELLGLFLDDGWLALGILSWVLLGLMAQGRGLPASPWVAIVFAVGLVVVLAASAVRRAMR